MNYNINYNLKKVTPGGILIMKIKIYQIKTFKKWAAKYDIKDIDLISAVKEISKGLYGAYLGYNIYKKRLAVQNRSKSRGVRVILVYLKNKQAYFIYGFSKNEIANISDTDLKAIYKLADIYLKATDEELFALKQNKILFEVDYD